LANFNVENMMERRQFYYQKSFVDHFILYFKAANFTHCVFFGEGGIADKSHVMLLSNGEQSYNKTKY